MADRQMTNLYDITRMCRDNEVALWILISPMYQITKTNSMIIYDLRVFTEIQCVNFIDFSQSADFSSYLLFRDNLHLNSLGACKYSSILANSIHLYFNEIESSKQLN